MKTTLSNAIMPSLIVANQSENILIYQCISMSVQEISEGRREGVLQAKWISINVMASFSLSKKC